MLLEFSIVDAFLNFDALTRLFLQSLACITELQLRRMGGDGCISRVRGRDGFETDGYGRDGFGSYRYGRGWTWKLRVRGGDGLYVTGTGGTGLKATGMDRDGARGLSPCRSLVSTLVYDAMATSVNPALSNS